MKLKPIPLHRLKKIINNDTGDYDPEFQKVCKELYFIREYLLSPNELQGFVEGFNEFSQKGKYHEKTI